MTTKAAFTPAQKSYYLLTCDIDLIYTRNHKHPHEILFFTSVLSNI